MRTVNGDHIRPFENFFHADLLDAVILRSRLFVTAVCDDLHAKALCHSCRPKTDCAKSDDSHRFLVELNLRHEQLIVACLRIRFFFFPVPCFGVIALYRHVMTDVHEQCHRILGNGDIAVNRIRYGHAPASCHFHIEVFKSMSQRCDIFQIRMRFKELFVDHSFVDPDTKCCVGVPDLTAVIFEGVPLFLLMDDTELSDLWYGLQHFVPLCFYFFVRQIDGSRVSLKNDYLIVFFFHTPRLLLCNQSADHNELFGCVTRCFLIPASEELCSDNGTAACHRCENHDQQYADRIDK